VTGQINTCFDAFSFLFYQRLKAANGSSFFDVKGYLHEKPKNFAHGIGQLFGVLDEAFEHPPKSRT
jgi:hypothetical protein